MLCAGCFGFLVDKPWTKDIQNPMPLKVDRFPISSERDRWACQPSPDPSAPVTKLAFLTAWGEPTDKVVTTKGETWIYAEKGRWCGLWIAFVVPVPLLLPVCETFDHVEFEGELAVRSESRRMDRFGMGLLFYYFIPFPLMVVPAAATDNSPMVDVVGWTKRDRSCLPKMPSTPSSAAPGGAPSPGDAGSPGDDFINCVSGGERKWTPRSKCD